MTRNIPLVLEDVCFLKMRFVKCIFGYERYNLLNLRGKQNISPLKNPLVLSQLGWYKTSTFKLNGYIAGFTLVELLAVLSILAILLLFAVPSGQHLLAKNRTTAYIHTLMGALHYARNEAIVRNEKLVFCKSADQKKCGGQWHDGQIVLDPRGKVLRVFSETPAQDTLVWNSSGGLDDFIVWLPSGYTNAQRGTFYYCAGSKKRDDAHSIVLLHTGRSYMAPITEAEYAAHCQ